MTSYKKLYLDLKQQIKDKKQQEEERHKDKKQQEEERQKAEAEQKIKNNALAFTTKPHDFIYDETEKSLSWEVYRIKEGYSLGARRIMLKKVEKPAVAQVQKEIEICKHEKLDIVYKSRVTVAFMKKASNYGEHELNFEREQQCIDDEGTLEITCTKCGRQFNPDLESFLCDFHMKPEEMVMDNEEFRELSAEERDILGF